MERSPMSCTSKKDVLKVLLLASVVCLLASYAIVAIAGQLTITGAPTMKPVVDEGCKEFAKINPDVKIVVGIGGTAHGYTTTGKGESQIGMVTRLPTEKEKSECPDFQTRILAVDGTAIAVHASNPVKNITREQMAGICTGKITNWKELGGADSPILFTCPLPKLAFYEVLTAYFKVEGKLDGTTIVFKDKDAKDYASVQFPTVDSTSNGLAAIVTKPNGITVTSVGAALALAAKGAPVKLLDLDGSAATEANVVSGSYPLPRKLMFVTKGEPKDDAKSFIDFMCDGPGKILVKKYGFFENK